MIDLFLIFSSKLKPGGGGGGGIGGIPGGGGGVSDMADAPLR